MSHDRFNALVDLAADPGGGPGPLAGVSVGVKSNIAVAGLPHTGGMAHLRGHVAPRDARVVAQLRTAGARIIGTLNMHEAALGATTDNAFYGRTHNPHRMGFTPGGSSGGSGAAVAAGLVDLALGTDTLGSIRLPAAYCGVYGLKPTHGAVSEDGLLYLDPAFDCIGPLARDLDLIARAWDVIGTGGADGDFARLVLLDDLGGVSCEPAVLAGYRAALAAIDLPVTPLSLPAAPGAIRLAALSGSVRYLIAALGQHRSQASAELRFILSALESVPPEPQRLAGVKAALLAALGDDGVLLLPTAPQAAFAHANNGSTRAPANQADFTALANIAGLPAIALPSGMSTDGLPVSVQLVGPAGSERRLIALARMLDAQLNAYHAPKGE